MGSFLPVKLSFFTQIQSETVGDHKLSKDKLQHCGLLFFKSSQKQWVITNWARMSSNTVDWCFLFAINWQVTNLNSCLSVWKCPYVPQFVGRGYISSKNFLSVPNCPKHWPIHFHFESIYYFFNFLGLGQFWEILYVILLDW